MIRAVTVCLSGASTMRGSASSGSDRFSVKLSGPSMTMSSVVMLVTSPVQVPPSAVAVNASRDTLVPAATGV